jgi:hypothetical protein
VAKSGIRTVMARLAANDLANPLLLDITRDEYANDGCYTGVLDPRSPPSDPLGYTKKPCGSFEEYIASVAVNSVKLGFGVFNAEDLPQIFTLYCAKVGAHCADRDGNKIGRPLFANDLEANQFIVDTIAFIERAKDLTRPAYDDSIGHDGKPVGEIPFLAEIAAACADHGVAGLDADSPRSLIRACNRAIVDRKLNGDPDLQIPPPLPAELVTQARALELQKKLGAKNLVLKDLRVRVSNESAHDVAETVVRMYIGDGVRTSTYDVKTQVPLVGLAAGTTRVLERDGDGHPLFPMAFVLPNLAPDVRSAIAFFVDPERRVPEANKRDNQASFFYYELNRLNPAGPDPHLPETPEPPIQDVSSDPLCRAEPAFTLTLGIRRVEDTAALATNQLTVTMGQPVRLEYRVQSRATTTLKQLTIHRTGASDRVFAPVDLPPASQNPAGYHNVEEFSPDAAGTFVIVATGAAQDARGNTIRAESPRVSLTVTRAPCDVAITTLKPDPNPFDRNTGLPVSEIMEGGSLFRHYRVLNGRTGQPLPGTELRVRGRELPGGAFFDLPPGTTDDDGYIVHEPTSLFDDSLRGLKLDVATLDAGAPAHPNQRFEIRLEPQQSDVDNSCGQTFEVAVKDREFTRTFATGTSLKIATRRLFGPFGIAGNVGIGIDLSQTASPAPTQPGAPPPVPKPLTLGRSLNLTSQLQTGAQLKSLKNALFGKDSKVELSGQGSLGVVLMGQDKHEFETPLSLGACIDMAYLVESTLMVGAAAAVPVPVPGLTLVMLALDEITQRVSGISDRRTSFGAAAGVAVGGGLDLKFPAVRFQNSGVSFFDDKGASGVDLAVSVGGALSETAGLSYSSTIAPAASEQLVTGTITTKIAGQFGLNFAAGAAEAKEDTGEAADNVDEHAFAAVADELTRGLQASGSGSMTFAATWDASQIPPPMKQIAFSISAEVGWGITQEILDGTAGGSGSSGSTRKWSFTVSEPLKFPSALESIVVIHALIAGQAAGGATGSVLLGPTALQKQFMKLIALADSFSSEIEYGAGHEFELGVSKLTGSKNLPNIGLSFKYDESVSHETESGSIRRGGKFRLASYADQDALVPSPDGTALADTINSCLDAVQPGTSAALARTIATIATGVGAAKSIVDVILTPGAPTPPFDAHAQAGGPLEATPAYQSPAPSTGASLLVDGASEPDPDQPLEIEALAFEYRAQQETPDVPIQRPFDVRGRLDRPHYGIGGFFQFAPDARPLAAPATLTIRYSDAEISAADESALGIFVWDDNARDWAFLGGTVDTAANTITVDVTRLGMYAAGLPMPSGTVSFTAQSLSGAADPNPTTNVTYTSGVIRMNTGAVVPDGTLFTVHVVAENAADLSPFGSIQSADEDPASDGVQVSAHGGVVQFSAELPGKSGSARVFVSSVVGTALADQVVTYQ